MLPSGKTISAKNRISMSKKVSLARFILFNSKNKKQACFTVDFAPACSGNCVKPKPNCTLAGRGPLTGDCKVFYFAARIVFTEARRVYL